MFDYILNKISDKLYRRHILLDTYKTVYGDLYDKGYEYYITRVILFGKKIQGTFDIHWEKKVYFILSDLFDLTLNDYKYPRYPSVEFILEHFFYRRMYNEFAFGSRLNRLEERLRNEETYPLPRRNDVTVGLSYILYQDFAKKCAIDLSTFGRIDPDQFHKYISQLFY